MLFLHELATLFGFFVMLLSPCVSATLVTLRWDEAEAAYLKFEAQVARMMEPNAKPVESNLCIRPYSAWARFHVEAAPLESTSEFRLRVFTSGSKIAVAVPRQPETVAA